MKVTSLTPRAFEFACHSKACAPPPAGTGGSDRGGKWQSRSSAINGPGPSVAENRHAARLEQAKAAVTPKSDVGKQGVMKMTQQAAHRAEAARQIDLRNRLRAQQGGKLQEKIRTDGLHGNRGGPVTGPKKPLYDATTGRLNPSPVRGAFKQGVDEIIGKKQDSKRTVLKPGGKVRTTKTYKGRETGHVSSKGGLVRKKAPAYMDSQLAKNVQQAMKGAYANMLSYGR